MKLCHPIILGSHVETDKGEGFIVGRNFKSPPRYSIRMLDGRILHTFPVDGANDEMVLWVKLIASRPIDHPNLPKGLRQYLLNPS